MTKDGHDKPSLSARLNQKTQALRQSTVNEESMLIAHGSRIKSLLTSLESEVSDSAKRISAEMEAIKTTWTTRILILLGGMVAICAIAILMTTWLANRTLTSKRDEIARLEQTITEAKMQNERLRMETEQLEHQMTRLNQKEEAINLINSSLDFGQSAEGTEIYLREGWKTIRCTLADGARVNHCIRRN